MMNFSERAYRALRVGLLVFALCAVVWPATKYSSRLELLSRVAVPTSAEQVTPPAKVFWYEATNAFVSVVSVRDAPLTDRYLKRQTSVYATVPTYQAALTALTRLRQRARAESELSRYASCCVSQPADRGPPFFV